MNSNQIIHVPPMSNREFLEKHAQAGRIGLVSGSSLLEKAIQRAERHLDAEGKWGLWTHAMVFEGCRADGQHWVVESNMKVRHKHIQLGVQENRIGKYFDEAVYKNVAVLDFGLTEAQVSAVLREGLDMVASHATYPLRALIGTAVALRHPWFRPRENLLARKKSMYCSGFVQYVFGKAGIDLAPGVHSSHSTPEDISRTPVPHTTYLLSR